MKRPTLGQVLVIGATLALGIAGAAAQETRSWTDTAELSFVSTGGNTEATSLGFKNQTLWNWERSSVTVRFGGVRIETTDIVRFAIPGGDDVYRVRDERITAENYYFNGRYDRNITDRFFWYVGAGWDRNEPAGIQNRYIGEGGVGNIWRDDDKVFFRTSYALTYTDQEDVIPNPDPNHNDTFAGARLSYDYSNALTGTTDFLSNLIFDYNFDQTSDWRVNWINAVAVSMSETLAFKLSYQILYDNEPSFELLPLGPGLPADQPRPVKDTDTIATASLVVNF